MRLTGGTPVLRGKTAMSATDAISAFAWAVDKSSFAASADVSCRRQCTHDRLHRDVDSQNNSRNGGIVTSPITVVVSYLVAGRSCQGNRIYLFRFFA